MLEVVDTGINSFASVASQADVSPSEEPVFILTSGQLEAIILQAIEKATAPLESRIEELERGVGCREGGEDAIERSGEGQGSHLLQDKITLLEFENRGLKAALSNLEELRPWLEAISKKISRLEAPTPSRKTEARAEKIAKYLKERPDHKATFETLRGHLGIDKRRLLEAIKLLMATDPGRYGIARFPGDKRGRALIMLPK
jgi:hypothetical protein